ncbi:MAG: hypothetical protein LQ340_001038 [Diploschistes diacapsis]|nr:MAG: hypothetical protein LQ340_001038 [Diploschistes diacapsis]
MANLSLSYYKNQKPVTTMTSSVLQKGTAVEQRLSKRTDPDLLETELARFAASLAPEVLQKASCPVNFLPILQHWGKANEEHDALDALDPHETNKQFARALLEDEDLLKENIIWADALKWLYNVERLEELTGEDMSYQRPYSSKKYSE